MEADFAQTMHLYLSDMVFFLFGMVVGTETNRGPPNENDGLEMGDSSEQHYATRKTFLFVSPREKIV